MENPTQVVNIRKGSYDIYIGRGRGSIWGNPYEIGKDGSRTMVVLKYELHLLRELQTGKKEIEDLKELFGKVLGCFCAPDLCHGDIVSWWSFMAHTTPAKEFMDMVDRAATALGYLLKRNDKLPILR